MEANKALRCDLASEKKAVVIKGIKDMLQLWIYCYTLTDITYSSSIDSAHMVPKIGAPSSKGTILKHGKISDSKQDTKCIVMDKLTSASIHNSIMNVIEEMS